MSDFEKYVEPAASAIDPAAFDPSLENYAGYVRQARRDKASDQARAMLAAVGPLIAEDTRERMVAAAARAVERDQATPERLTCEEQLVALADRAAFGGGEVAAPAVVLDSRGVPWLVYVTEDGDSFARTVVGPNLPTLLDFDGLLDQSGGAVTAVWPVMS